MHVKRIPTKQLALSLALILVCLSQGVFVGYQFGKFNPPSTPNLSNYEWVLKVDGARDDQAFHRWPANQQMELKGPLYDEIPEIIYKITARAEEASPYKVEIKGALSLRCTSRGEGFQIQFNENSIPNALKIHQLCGPRLWNLSLQLI